MASKAVAIDPVWKQTIQWQRYSMVHRDAHLPKKRDDDNDDAEYGGYDARAAERLDIEDRAGHVTHGLCFAC